MSVSGCWNHVLLYLLGSETSIFGSRALSQGPGPLPEARSRKKLQIPSSWASGSPNLWKSVHFGNTKLKHNVLQLPKKYKYVLFASLVSSSQKNSLLTPRQWVESIPSMWLKMFLFWKGNGCISLSNFNVLVDLLHSRWYCIPHISHYVLSPSVA